MRPQELTKIGLSEKEAAVYLALLELGSDTVQNIGKKANVNRATTYVILDSLAKKGVVSTVEKGKKTYFAAESPETLVRLLHLRDAEMKEQDRQLRELLPQLKGIYNLAENKPVVRFYEGKDGLRVMHDEFLRSSDREIDMIYSRDHVERVFTDEERKDIGRERKEKGKKIRTLYTYTGSPLSEIVGETTRRQLPSDQFMISCDVAISGNRVRIASLGKALSGVVIEDIDIANTLRSIFNLAWEAAEKYQKK